MLETPKQNTPFGSTLVSGAPQSVIFVHKISPVTSRKIEKQGGEHGLGEIHQRGLLCRKIAYFKASNSSAVNRCESFIFFHIIAVIVNCVWTLFWMIAIFPNPEPLWFKSDPTFRTLKWFA